MFVGLPSPLSRSGNFASGSKCLLSCLVWIICVSCSCLGMDNSFQCLDGLCEPAGT